MHGPVLVWGPPVSSPRAPRHAQTRPNQRTDRPTGRLQARNKTFDVCYEAGSDPGEEIYELIAHVPQASSNYLRAAVSGLQKNT